MKTRLFIALALLVIALTVIPASATYAASPTAPSGAGASAVTKDVIFVGTIQKLPQTLDYIGKWQVSGKTVNVRLWTYVNDIRFHVRVGAKVRVEAITSANGIYKATLIKILN